MKSLRSLVLLDRMTLVMVLLGCTHIDKLLECLVWRIVALILLRLVDGGVLQPLLADVRLDLGLPDKLPVFRFVQYFLIERRSAPIGKTCVDEVLNIRPNRLLVTNCILSNFLRQMVLPLFCRPGLLGTAWVDIWNTEVSWSDYSIFECFWMTYICRFMSKSGSDYLRPWLGVIFSVILLPVSYLIQV